MRLTEIQAPAVTDKDYEFMNDHVPLLEEHCSEIIREIVAAKKLLYRGEQDKYSTMVRTIWTNRKSLYMPDDFAYIIEEAYTKLGISANRQNSIFTTPSTQVANAWGQAYIVFPVNGYKFSYFTEVTQGEYAFDALHALLDTLFGYKLDTLPKDKFKTNSEVRQLFNDEFVKKVVKQLKGLGITDTDLQYAMNHDCEVLFTGTEYYSFKGSEWVLPIRKWLNEIK